MKDDNMKILHILNYVGRGGSESYIKNLAVSNNSTHELIYNVDGGGVGDFEVLGVKCTHCDIRSPLDIRAAKFLKRYVIENEIDLVHTHFMRENGVAFLAKLIGMRVPVINTRHMLSHINVVQKLLNRIFFTKNKYVFAVSSRVRTNLLSEGVRDSKIITLPPPLPIVVANKNPKPDGERWIVSVGRLSPEKGPLFFVDALNELFKSDDAKNYKALIIGYGELEAEVRDKIAAYNLDDRVIMLGYQKPYDYLAAADIFVNHSKEEAFGFSIVEAASLGAALLIEENAGATDYFNEENSSALTFKFGDTNEFNTKMKMLMKDDAYRKKIAENAKNIATSTLDQKKIIEIIEKIYEGAIYGK